MGLGMEMFVKERGGPSPPLPAPTPLPLLLTVLLPFFFLFFKLASCGPLTLPAAKAWRISCFVPHHTPSAWKVLVNTCE